MISKKNLLISTLFLTSCMTTSVEVPQHRETYDERYEYCNEFWSHESELWFNCITRIAHEETAETTTTNSRETSWFNTTVHGNTGTST